MRLSILEKIEEIDSIKKELLEQTMKSLVGIRVLNFKIGIAYNKKKDKSYLYAFQYKNGIKCHINLGNVYSLIEIEQQLRLKLNKLVERKPEFGLFQKNITSITEKFN